MSHDKKREPDDFESRLYSNNSRLIKEALDFYTNHPALAAGHLDRIQELKRYAEEHVGIGAVQVEVAAIIVFNQLTFQKR